VSYGTPFNTLLFPHRKEVKMATTFAKNMIYNDHSLKEFKCILCSIGESLDIDKELGIDFKPLTDKSDSSNYTFDFGTTEGEPLKINMTIMHCDHTPFNEFTHREIINWLLPDKNLHWLAIYDNNISDIYYLCRVTSMTKKVINNKIIGYSITFTCNSTCGYTELLRHDYNINSSSTFTIYSDTDSLSYLYPDLIIIPMTETISIKNMTDNNRILTLNHCVIGDEIHIDGKYQEIYSDQKESYSDSFNWNFFRLVPRLNNEISVEGSCSLSISYRNERRVGEY
jgi:phage-related protein